MSMNAVASPEALLYGLADPGAVKADSTAFEVRGWTQCLAGKS
jgi:hypothetical protein